MDENKTPEEEFSDFLQDNWPMWDSSPTKIREIMTEVLDESHFLQGVYQYLASHLEEMPLDNPLLKRQRTE
jgi:hypothetical protein